MKPREGFDSVDAHYVRKVIAELVAEGKHKAARLMLEGVYAKGRRIYWKRDSL